MKSKRPEPGHLVVGADQQLSLCWPLEGKGPQVQREEELRGGSTGAVSRFLPELSPCIWELLAAAPKAGLNNVFVFHEELKAIEISSCWGRLFSKFVNRGAISKWCFITKAYCFLRLCRSLHNFLRSSFISQVQQWLGFTSGVRRQLGALELLVLALDIFAVPGPDLCPALGPGEEGRAPALGECLSEGGGIRATPPDLPTLLALSLHKKAPLCLSCSLFWVSVTPDVRTDGVWGQAVNHQGAQHPLPDPAKHITDLTVDLFARFKSSASLKRLLEQGQSPLSCKVKPLARKV